MFQGQWFSNCDLGNSGVFRKVIEGVGVGGPSMRRSGIVGKLFPTKTACPMALYEGTSILKLSTDSVSEEMKDNVGTLATQP